MGTTLMLVSRRRSGFSETDRLLPGETGDIWTFADGCAASSRRPT